MQHVGAMGLEFLSGGGELGELIRRFDWSRTPLGPLDQWPQSLKTATAILLRSPVPIVLLWGADGIMIYNDAYAVFGGARHPRLLGSKVLEGWPEVADFNANLMRVGLAGGTLAYRDQHLILHRHGRAEDVWMNLDSSPVLDEAGHPAGVLAIVAETTERVVGERRLRTLASFEPKDLAASRRWVAVDSEDTSSAPPALLEGPRASDYRFAKTAGARILIADDNADMRAYLRDLLSPMYRVEAVTDGERALDAALRDRPDLILTDVMLPRLDGLALLARLRGDERQRDTPVILLSARSGEEARIEGLHAGADDYLVKPFSGRELLARVGTLLELTRMRRESLHEEARVQRLLAKVSQALVASQLDLEQVVQTATDVATELTGAAFGAFFYNVRGGTGETHTLYTLSGAPREAFSRFPHPRSTAIFGPTFRGEAMIRSADITADARYGHNAPYYGMPKGHLPVRSYLAVPVKTALGEVIGGLFFGHPEPGVFTERTEVLVLAIAAQAAVAFDNARLHRAAQAELEERRRMEAALTTADRQKDEFLAMLAHELRNPLAPITNASELLLHTLRPEGRTRIAIDMIRRQTAHLTRLVDDLLDVSRITQGRIQLKRQSVDLADVIAQALEIVEPRMRAKGLQLSNASVSRERVCVAGDLDRLIQCVANVLANATKYTDNGGQIRVEIRTEGESAIIEISDTGVGIAPDLLPRVFDLFVQSHSTLDRSQGGLGIGLALVKRLVEMHEGTVIARSQGIGQGAVFEIRLPRITPPEPC